MRTEFINPLYDPRYPETGIAPPGEDDPSSLPVEDPEFEPELVCPPKLLFAEARTKTRRGQAAKGKDRTNVSAFGCLTLQYFLLRLPV